MSQDLVIHLRDDGRLSWSILTRESGERLTAGAAHIDALPDLPAEADVSRTLLLLPAERVFATQVEVPARSEREARQAAPFLIEDELASNLDETRIVTGAKGADGRRWVFAAEDAWIGSVIDALAPFITRPLYCLPDALAAADSDAALTLYDRDGHILFWYGAGVRDLGQQAGGAADPAFFNHIAHALVAGAAGGDIKVSPSLGLMGPGFISAQREDLDMRTARLGEGVLSALPALAGEKWLSTLDWGESLSPLRRAAMMAAALLIGLGLLTIGEGVYYRIQAERYDEASVAVFRQAVPEVTRRVIPAEAERLLRERIAGLGGGETSSFLQLTAALTALVEDNERVRVENIRFDQSRGELRVSAVYSEFADFDALSAEAAAIGVELQDEGAREGEGGLQGEFVVRLR